MPSLTDPLGRTHTYLRISVTDRCNLRCIYCRPQGSELLRPRAEILSLEEILRVARLCVHCGVDKIRLTGGEPLLRKNLEWLIEQLALIPGLKTIGLTTNGILLRKKARILRSAGLTALNISVDSLRRDRLQEITLRNVFDDLRDGIEAAIEAGFSPLKLNVVVMRGVNDDELLDFVNLTRSQPIHVRFIEFMPFKGNRWLADTALPYSKIREIIETRFSLLPISSPSPHSTTKDYRIDGFNGLVSFITPMSDTFCDHCNRLRLTADGSVKSCLFYPAEVNLRTALRTGADDRSIITLIHDALRHKHDAHPQNHDLLTTNLNCMTGIGG